MILKTLKNRVSRLVSRGEGRRIAPRISPGLPKTKQMAEKKTSYNLIYIIVIAALMALGFFLGSKNNTLSKKQEESISNIAVLKANRDSILENESKLKKRIEILEATVKQSDVKIAIEANKATNYKKKYKLLKLNPSPCDTFIRLVSCDSLVNVYESYNASLTAGMLSYIRLSDTLRLSNKYLEQANNICSDIVNKQNKELTQSRKSLRRRGILNWSLSGIVAGMAVVLLIK